MTTTLAQDLGIARTHPAGWDIKFPTHEDAVYPDWVIGWDLDTAPIAR